MNAPAQNKQLIDNAQFSSLREKLRHEWKVLADEWVERQDKADRYDEGKKILLAEMKLNLISGSEKDGKNLPVGKAELMARASKQYKEYAHKMYDAIRKANQAKMDRDDADRKYWEAVGRAADSRAERRGG